MMISRTTRTALDLIDALRAPGRIDPRLARQVSLSLRRLIEPDAFGPSGRLLRSRARRVRFRPRDTAAFRPTRCSIEP
ncbi:hypothetical protein [Rathayibacter rathayi]|uniref:Uncharacterized protein n=1 Tax=Rathayibacter rathayi TaxID=33887 RepID=A0ABD6W8C9_RATRA|nr:hypothetical protein [Rathayibacter rathayi]AZZ48191.1 hypothetical protein C1O28_02390 [Rathayibacter rathayi]MWV75473.1 hypothetical protein [Rathayibacter rathayi NCPPB 2980 = VKM Ac-1601]PPF13722.1 hypothetical protein C5C04_09155 [Rathayibacter rathayi]PPF23551.1 hypothetical protein C5C34_08175 [Rathayibacter rathayi]PPF48366.1 hypothetical protein C5C08_09300 [Rathayibacter rathayi]